jgi:hypothetical protein
MHTPVPGSELPELPVANVCLNDRMWLLHPSTLVPRIGIDVRLKFSSSILISPSSPTLAMSSKLVSLRNMSRRTLPAFSTSREQASSSSLVSPSSIKSKVSSKFVSLGNTLRRISPTSSRNRLQTPQTGTLVTPSSEMSRMTSKSISLKHTFRRMLPATSGNRRHNRGCF